MPTFRIGTRKSAMALAQTAQVVRLIEARWPGVAAQAVTFATAGDDDQTSKLARHGGKGGAFVAQIRDAIQRGALQAAMHSLKDMPGNEETPGLVIGAYLRRDDANDALVVRPGLDWATIRAAEGKGFRLGTNSIRRAALVRRLLPQVEVIHFRGAADTRVRKLDTGEGQRMPDGSRTAPADALIMAASGLHRVGLGERIAHVFATGDMLPSAGQGIVAVECRADDWQTRERLAGIDDAASRSAAQAEREALWVLDGHCNSPIAAHAVIDGDSMTLTVSVTNEDGSRMITESRTAAAGYPRELGRTVGLALVEQGAREIIESLR